MSHGMMQEEGGSDPRVGGGQGREGQWPGGQGGDPRWMVARGVRQPLGLGLAEAKKVLALITIIEEEVSHRN
jgi:hypothetical protein